MKAGRSEAFDVLRKFEEESTLLDCRAAFPLLAFRFRARVAVLMENELRLMGDGSSMDFGVRLPEDLEFAFGDATEHAQFLAGTLALIFRRDERGIALDYMTLSEIIAGI